MPENSIQWTTSAETHTALWRSENGTKAPARVVVGDDSMSADTAYLHASQGTAILWGGDFQNARQLLQALSRRIDRKPRRAQRRAPKAATSITETFHRFRLEQLQRARILGMLLIPLNKDYTIPLRRAPDVKQACLEAHGKAAEDSIVSLREILGLIGAHEWHKKGVDIPALGQRIHPNYAVFSPIRGEYIKLVADAPLPSLKLAFDIGTGTGVLAAVLARRGMERIIATDLDPRALICAQENIAHLDLQNQVDVVKADLFPQGKASLVVCNPPWIPAKPSSSLENAVYDPDSRMLKGFLDGLASHLETDGEGWLILSDLAEHLGLRTREELLAMIENGGLVIKEKMDIRPTHSKLLDADDPLHMARKAEITSLWRLGIKQKEG
jgi:methylase of polypeptide subunit release factors